MVQEVASEIWQALSVSAYAVNFVPLFVRGHSLLDSPVGIDTAFTIYHVFFVIWWAALYLWQISYLVHLFDTTENGKFALAIAPHFVLFNTLEFIWSLLWMYDQWWLAELVVVINLLQITRAYFAVSPNQSSFRRYFWIQAPTVALPFAYLTHMVLWNGAAAAHAHSTASRIVANVMVWVLLLLPACTLAGFNDWINGFAFAFLTAGLGVSQFFTKVVALQWIFAFTIMSVVFAISVVVASLRLGVVKNSHDAAANDEQAPLLNA